MKAGKAAGLLLLLLFSEDLQRQQQQNHTNDDRAVMVWYFSGKVLRLKFLHGLMSSPWQRAYVPTCLEHGKKTTKMTTTVGWLMLSSRERFNLFCTYKNTHTREDTGPAEPVA